MLIIVIVAVIAVAILLETPHHARGTTATSTIIHNSSGANSNSIQTGSNSTQQSRVEAELCSSLGGIVGSGGGAGGRYISENESAALVGSGGEYYECEVVNYTEIDVRYNLSGEGVAAVYAVYYTIPNSSAVVYERAFITNNSRKMYDSFLRSIANMTPMTVYNQSTRNGMIYSYVNIPSSSGNVTDLLGYTGGEVTYISAEAESINTTLLVDTVSSDMQ